MVSGPGFYDEHHRNQVNERHFVHHRDDESHDDVGDRDHTDHHIHHPDFRVRLRSA